MTLPVVFRRAARAEFDAAALRYDEQRAGLGLQFMSEIDRAVQLAEAHPERFPVKHGKIRCVQARRFPYSVFYCIERHRIVTLAVFHARRDPTIYGRHAHDHDIDTEQAPTTFARADHRGRCHAKIS